MSSVNATVERLISQHIVAHVLAVRAARIQELSKRIGSIIILGCSHDCNGPATGGCSKPPCGFRVVASKQVVLPVSDVKGGHLSATFQMSIVEAFLSAELEFATACRICRISEGQEDDPRPFLVTLFKKEN